MKFTPLNDRLLIKRTEAETVSDGGIVIPDNAKEKPLEGEVIAVGTGKLLKDGSRGPSALAAGNTILFGKYSGDEVKINGEDHLILREDEVLAIIEN